MELPDRFADLPAYAFPRLRALLDHVPPGGPQVAMTIGEPQHAFPDWVTDIVARNAAGFNRYPPNDGTPELRQAYADWLARRYGVRVDPDTRVLPLNGTREGLYNAAMALCPERKNGAAPLVAMPNPFYQVYMLAALSVAAEPVFVPATHATGHLPDFSALPRSVLDRLAMVYVCSPANPQGAVAGRDYWARLLDLAETHDFRILADECYSEIYRSDPPPGVLSAASEVGADPERVLAFHSLSKRSNLPGLRSGFVAGGPAAIAAMKQLRNYTGAPLPLPLQAAATAVWGDEAHVDENRALYRAKFDQADQIFEGVQAYTAPQAGFFLWLPVDDGERAALQLWQETGTRVLPGAYLSQTAGGENPGKGYIRAALVAPPEDVARGLNAIRATLYG